MIGAIYLLDSLRTQMLKGQKLQAIFVSFLIAPGWPIRSTLLNIPLQSRQQ